MSDSKSLTQAIKYFNSCTAELRKWTLDNAEYYEVVEVIEDGQPVQVKRRPVVVINDGRTRAGVQQRIDKWKAAREELHNADPIRFPMNSVMFTPEPTLYTDVFKCGLYVNRATSTRNITGHMHVRRLERMLKGYKIKPDHGSFEYEIKRIEDEIKRFTDEGLDKQYRIRADNYNEVILKLRFEGDTADHKIKVHDSGIYLCSISKHEHVRYKRNELHITQSETKEKRASVYDHVEPISTYMPYNGKLYRISDIVETEARIKQNMIRGIYDKKSDDKR
ncbi:hypothetical protein JCM19237_282 [Photobacterium aphoticum]|uniref:Uncharacterized protein n=1 Tax=Photobacterium aphoticum TaxID=754436 RepID=A0A090RK83_9GAMM|nr:hypothetical protein JCM19237_282 [Photobacterium aphoticum]